MAETREVAGDVVYRPLSGLAVAGFAISCLFGGVVAVSAVMALVQGAPFFFSTWTLLVAVAGFVVSWWGLNDIRNAEGTKAGQKLATWGMWISLVTGAGYFAYSYFTGLALSQQAYGFLLKYDTDSGFFPRLQKGGQDRVEANQAFLLTVPYSDRAGARPEDEERLAVVFDKSISDMQQGNLSRFRSNDLVIGLAKGGTDCVFEPLGIQEWKYEKRSYQVRCLLRVRMPEAQGEVTVTVRSSEGEREGEARRWFVDMTQTGFTKHERTPLGEGLRQLRGHAGNYVRSWDTLLRKGDKSLGLDRLDATNWSKIDPAVRDQVKSQTTAIFGGAAGDISWYIQVPPEVPVTEWDRDSQGRLELSIPFTLMTGTRTAGLTTNLDSLAVVRTKMPLDPAAYASAPGTPAPDFEVKEVKIVRHRQNKK